MITLGISSVLIFVLSSALVGIVINQFSQKLIDYPNERSSHSRPTPRGGGIGFIISFYAGLSAISISFQLDLGIPLLIWVIPIPLAIIGFVDDWLDLPASTRYLVQLVVSTITVTNLGAFPLFPSQDQSLGLSLIATLITIIGMTALINFYNFMDGLDGLIAGNAIVQFICLGILGNNPSLFLLASSIGGFLIWNWSPAKIFMGDSGSTFIGGVVAIAIIKNATNIGIYDGYAALTVTLPITLDTTYTLIKRLKNRENIFKAHKSHLFQRLNQAGWNHSNVALLYTCASLMCGLMILVKPYFAISNLLFGVICLIGFEKYLSRKSGSYI